MKEKPRMPSFPCSKPFKQQAEAIRRPPGPPGHTGPKGPTGPPGPWATEYELGGPDANTGEPVSMWVAEDGSRIWFNGLDSGALNREQTLAMLQVLNKKFVLDSMSDL